MDVESCLLSVLKLPSRTQVHRELCVNLLPELANLVEEYARQDVFTLAHSHFTCPEGSFLSIRDLTGVVSYLYENKNDAKDVTARGPALLWYLRRMVRGMLPIAQWPDRMRDYANRIIDTSNGSRRGTTWCFRARLSSLEDRYAFCECAECKVEDKPEVIELLCDVQFIETLLDRLVMQCVEPDPPAVKRHLMTDYQAPNLPIGFKFELGCALCE